MQTEVLDEFLFADDMAKGAPTEEKMQKGVDQVSESLLLLLLLLLLLREISTLWEVHMRVFVCFYHIISMTLLL